METNAFTTISQNFSWVKIDFCKNFASFIVKVTVFLHCSLHSCADFLNGTRTCYWYRYLSADIPLTPLLRPHNGLWPSADNVP